MIFKRLNFTKVWTDHAAFPTIETDEAKVRADMQALHDEAKAGLNGLMDELEAPRSAAKLGAVGPQGESSTVQEELNGLHAGMIQAGALPVGGSANQMLIKTSGENYATRWGSVSDIGAADRSHKHSTSDIESGILSVARGGTGERSLEALAAAMGMPMVEVGSYTGTGTTGSANVLTFEFQPKLVIIDGLTVFQRGETSAYTYTTPYRGGECTVTWSDYAVSWAVGSKDWNGTSSSAVGGATAENQLNASGTTYHYVAIG